jgi:Flp pilus assembly protein TadG
LFHTSDFASQELISTGKSVRKTLRESRGQVAVLYTMALSFFLIGVIALGTDVAVMYVNWQQTQKVADAAALAGANFLGTDLTYQGTIAEGCSGDEAEEAACTYAVQNGLTAANVTITEPSGTALKVVAQQSNLPYFFAKALGMTTYSVAATAEAQAPGNTNQVNNILFPMGLECASPCNTSSMFAGEPLTFGAKFANVGASGNWQWLDNGQGASGLGSAITNGMGGAYSVGGSITSEPGNKGNSNPVSSAFSDRMASCPTIADPCGGANPSDIPAGDPCEVVMPAVDFGSCTGSCATTIEGFVDVYLEPTSTSTSISGCFVKAVTQDATSGSGAPGFGSLTPDVLIQ